MNVTQENDTMQEITHEETIQKVVKEGLEARNLLNFIADGSLDELKVSKKPPTSPRPQSVSPKPPTFEMNKGINARLLPRSTKRHASLPRPKSRLRSASAGRNPDKSLRARYWTFLFENLHRAVDEIYQTCEMDESIVESKEAIMMLDNYSKDFHALIQYININKDYEKTAPLNRPTSLAWEVRKSSPGKSLLKNVFIEKLTAGSNAKRILCFDATNERTSTPKTENLSTSQQDVKIANIISNVQQSIPERADEVIPLDLSNESRKQCDIKISVVSADTDSSFPCNGNLIVNEVCYHNTEKPSLETHNEILGEKEKECSVTDLNADSDFKPVHLNIGSDSELTAYLNAPEFLFTVSKEGPLKADVEDNSLQTEQLTEHDNTNSETAPKPQVPSVKKSVPDVADSKVLLKRSKSSISEPTGMNKTPVRNPDVKTTVRKTPINKNVKDKVTTPLKEKVSQEKQSAVKSIPAALPHAEGKILHKQENNSSVESPNNSVPSENNRMISRSSQVKNPVSKSVSSSTRFSVNDNKLQVRNCAPATAVKSETPKFTNRKFIERADSVSERRKFTKPNSAESAIKRNISYVSSLSSRNHQERSANEVKKSSRPTSLKLSQKSGSMTSLNKTLNSHISTRKTLSVEKIPEAVKANTDDDSDGWEMVKSRNRSRNSPAKKLPFLGKNQENQAMQIAKLNQSRIGGFPYTNKSNLKTAAKTPSKSEALKKTGKQGNKCEKDEEKLPKTENKPIDSSTNKTENFDKTIPNLIKFNVECPHNENIKGRAKPVIDQLIESSHFGEIWFSEVPKKFLRMDRIVGKAASKLQCDSFLPNRLSSSTPNLYSKVDISNHKLSKAFCLSDQSLASQKYININIFKKKTFEKGSNSAKKKSKKTKIINDDSPGTNSLNGSLEESDNGLTSDDQDGTMSHDEFDVQCQELCDAAWKYKILEQQVRKLELSWGEQMDLFDLELRTPGRALEMHEKLSSPFRKKSLLESIRVCNEKQLKAQEQRERLLDEKAQKFKIIEKKRLEMKALIEERQEKQRFIMEQKLQKAEEKRKKQLQLIIRKAHDEKEKVNEIAFINSLEAQNKRHDLISKEKDHEARLQDIQEERQRKQEEKAAKEAAAEERRKILEAERLARLTEMQEKRKMRDHKVEQLFLVKEKERQELANQKARDRELRLSALNAQQQITIEELQKKIQLKQEESARRHEENMEQIRQKAFELSIRKCSSNTDDVPQPVPYETKKICTICNVLIGSEVYLLSHLHGKKHQEAVKLQYQGQDPSSEELELYNLKHIVDASTDQLDPNIALDKERQKALKKRCKKLRQRMSNRGQEYESEFTKMTVSVNTNVKNKMVKIMNDISKLSTMKDKNSIDPNVFSTLERCLNDMDSLFKKQLLNNKAAFQAIGGVTALVNIFNIVSMHQAGNNAVASKKTINHLSNLTESLIDRSHEICKFILFSNKVGNLLDFLLHRLNHLIPDNISQMMANNTNKSGEMNIRVDLAAWKLLHLLTGILINLSVEYSCSRNDENKEKTSDFQIRMQDMISYIVSIGIIDKLSQFFNNIQVLVSNDEEIAAFLLDGIHFLTTLVKLSTDCFSGATKQKTEDTTQLIATFRVTNMVGVVSFLYGLLLHNGSSSRGEEPPPKLSNQIEILAHSAIQMFNHVAVMNLQAFQSILGSEGLSLQLRHIVSHLLWYCSHLTSENLLHEIIILVGYFTVLNPENQSIIQAGQRPTVLQQLCCLPFLYFSDPDLTDILFPTLIACCYNNPENKTILQQEMTSELLSNFIEVKYLNLDDNDIPKKNKSCTSDISFNKYWSFSIRFPKCYWSPAKHYFSEQKHF